MNTVMEQKIETGDVLELVLPDAAGVEAVSAMVLLATDEFVILDRCDGSTPFVLRFDELGEYRRFEPSL